jgi:PPK2 family polyphosphate:nucleotide phosphotransferase
MTATPTTPTTPTAPVTAAQPPAADPAQAATQAAATPVAKPANSARAKPAAQAAKQPITQTPKRTVQRPATRARLADAVAAPISGSTPAAVTKVDQPAPTGKASKRAKPSKASPKHTQRTQLQVPTGKAASSFKLSAMDPGAKPYSSGKKADDKARVAQLSNEIDALQDVFFGDQRFKLLIVLQGMDTSGKDGTVRGVFANTSPLGMRVVSWKAPSSTEQAHDYLWRIHAQAPRNGEIVIFNRSHYEDVLVPVVNGGISAQVQQQRYAQLNDFERMLSENGTVILKFMLHISQDEQRQRLQERLDDPLKHWKFDVNDLTARAQWSAYQSAYEQLLRATSTPWAPWTVVPADSKTHRNLVIATLVRDQLASLGLRYPAGDPALAKLVIA